MLAIDEEGRVRDARITPHIIAGLTQGRLGVVHGIVVHHSPDTPLAPTAHIF